MTTDRKLGSAAGGTTSSIFRVAAGWDSPSGIMTLVENFLSGVDKAVPVKEAESAVTRILPVPANDEQAASEAKLVGNMENYADANGTLDRKGMIRYVADTFNSTMPGLKPDAKLVKQATDMLTHLGIQDDKDGTLAQGIARASMAGAISTQALEKKNVNAAALLTLKGGAPGAAH